MQCVTSSSIKLAKSKCHLHGSFCTNSSHYSSSPLPLQVYSRRPRPNPPLANLVGVTIHDTCKQCLTSDSYFNNTPYLG
uniref:Putative ovule protein n=1 Tax=Solanum chacoense TaxID=4108 RepID=A0A0V0HLC4_SOLCH